MTEHQRHRAELRRPPRLRRGDRVALLTPSSPSNIERIDEGIDVLRFCGLEPVELPTARARAATHSYLAGTDDDRAKDLRAALLDETVAGVLTVGGGYGSQRMLEKMDWSGLDASRPRSSWATRRHRAPGGAREQARVGIGDGADGVRGGVPRVVLVLLALGVPRRAGNAMDPSRSRMPARSSAVRRTASRPAATSRCSPGRSGPRRRGLRPAGSCSSRTRTRTPPDRHHAHAPPPLGILRERCGRGRREFTNAGESSADEVQAVLDDRLGDLGIPVITGANIGHGGHVQTWPIGVPARLDADARTVTFLEPPLV